MANNQNLPVSPLDTEGVSGGVVNAHPTSENGSVQDTEGAPGGSRDPQGAPSSEDFDTSGTNGKFTQFKPVDTSLTDSFDTSIMSAGGGPNATGPIPYVKPGVGVAAVTVDTSKSDVPGGAPAKQPSSYDVSNEDVNMIGAITADETELPVLPALAAAPTVQIVLQGGAYVAQVSWVKDSTPQTGFIIENDRTGTQYAGADETTQVMDNLAGGDTYRFRVARYNHRGVSPFSSWSDAVQIPVFTGQAI